MIGLPSAPPLSDRAPHGAPLTVALDFVQLGPFEYEVHTERFNVNWTTDGSVVK